MIIRETSAFERDHLCLIARNHTVVASVPAIFCGLAKVCVVVL
jgi:hypothetical protein